MKLAKIVVLAICVSLMTSGCFTKKSNKGAASTTGTNGTVSDEEMGPAPVASFLILDNGTALNATNETYEVSVNVNLTFDASNSTGANVSIAWDFGDNVTIGTIPEMPEPTNTTTPANTTTPTNTTANTTSPSPTTPTTPTTGTGAGVFFAPFLQQATNNTTVPTTTTPSSGNNNTTAAPENSVVVHAFNATGNFTVTLYVTDQYNRTDSMTAMMVITGGGAIGGANYTVSNALSASKACATRCNYLVDNGKNADSTFTIEEQANGTKAVEIEATLTTSGSDCLQGDLTLKDADGNTLATGTDTVTYQNYTTPMAAGTYTVNVAWTMSILGTGTTCSATGTATVRYIE